MTQNDNIDYRLLEMLNGTSNSKKIDENYIIELLTSLKNSMLVLNDATLRLQDDINQLNANRVNLNSAITKLVETVNTLYNNSK
ncbi:MAG: hypothetical protein HC836_25815 [Richelia sp. RM2_1_2]|nr:hypothetical protein [Richelia sp. RM2_1_2]